MYSVSSGLILKDGIAMTPEQIVQDLNDERGLAIHQLVRGIRELKDRVERMKTAGDELVVDVIEWMRAINECSASKHRIADWEKACDD